MRSSSVEPEGLDMPLKHFQKCFQILYAVLNERSGIIYPQRTPYSGSLFPSKLNQSRLSRCLTHRCGDNIVYVPFFGGKRFCRPIANQKRMVIFHLATVKNPFVGRINLHLRSRERQARLKKRYIVFRHITGRSPRIRQRLMRIVKRLRQFQRSVGGITVQISRYQHQRPLHG